MLSSLPCGVSPMHVEARVLLTPELRGACLHCLIAASFVPPSQLVAACLQE